jgi:peptidoglycan/xylan/chitin deacetylase (PgdA/CDA1 family)
MIARKIIQRSKWMTRDGMHKVGLAPLPVSGSGVRVLTYHGIDLQGRKDVNARFISADYFEKQIAYFSKHFNLVSVEDVFNGNVSQDILNIAITFDDGYANNLKYVLPIIEKHHVPATFFITGIRGAGMNILWPDLIDLATLECNRPVEIRDQVFKKNSKGELASRVKTLKQVCKSQDWHFKLEVIEALKDFTSFRNNSNLADYWKQLTTEQIKQLSKSPLVTIGSHGYYHNNLGDINYQDACAELEKSKTFLENTIQQEVSSIAYPDGSYTRELIDASQSIGYNQQLALEYLHEEDEGDDRILDRFGINPFISWINQLNCLVKNSYW